MSNSEENPQKITRFFFEYNAAFDKLNETISELGISAVDTNKTISSKFHMLLGYADEVDIIGRTIREVTTVFLNIEKE